MSPGFSFERNKTRHATSAVSSSKTSHVTNSAASGPLGMSAHLHKVGVRKAKSNKKKVEWVHYLWYTELVTF